MITLEEKYVNFVNYMDELINTHQMQDVKEALDDYPWRDPFMAKMMLGRFLPAFALQIRNKEVPTELATVAPNAYCLCMSFLDRISPEQREKLWLYLECFLFCLHVK